MDNINEQEFYAPPNEIIINNRNNLLLKEIPEYHPDSSLFILFWREQWQRIIEGYWFPDDKNINWDVETSNIENYKNKTDKWRFAPPVLYFYGNFATILHNDESLGKTSAKVKMRPSIRDIEWMIFYDVLQSRGFSGFELDEKYTCCTDIIDENLIPEQYHKSCFNSEGKLKEYINAFDYLRQIFTNPLGRPLYFNGAKNYMILGSRGFGKSFSIGAGVIAHELLVDGLKHYNPEGKIPKTEIFVGAAMASKSTDILKKTKECLDELPGKWKENTDEYEPSPLSKAMTGSLAPTKKWTHKVEVKIGGDWVDIGSGSNITHGIFTTENPESAAGGRYTLIIIEEVGLLPNLLTVLSSNEAAQAGDTFQMGSTIMIGTAGNIEKIQDSEQVFKNPKIYNCLEFDDLWEDSGKIGRFIPAYMRLNSYKDENGNTNIPEALEFYKRRRKDRQNNKDQNVLYGEKLNYPLKPSEMFLSKDGAFFPIEDLKIQYSNLLTNTRLLNNVRKVDLSLSKGVVNWHYSNKKSIDEYPYINSRGTDAPILIYEMPYGWREGKVLNDRYYGGLDPVDDDDVDNDASLQSLFIYDIFKDKIVAEYTARTLLKEEYFENVRRLLMFYNATCNYENQKKQLHTYFKNKNSLHLLAETPDSLKDGGYIRKNSKTGNKAYGTPANEAVNKWGRELILTWLLTERFDNNYGEIKDDEQTTILNLETIESLGLLQELIKYTPKKNCDRISALGMLMIYKADRERFLESSYQEKVKKTSEDDFFKKPFQNSLKSYTNKTFSLNNLNNYR